MRLWYMISATMLVSACSSAPEQRIDRDETLLSVAATGRTDTRPDTAVFTAGISTIRASGPEASKANAESMQKLVDALAQMGVAKDDVRTANLSISRIDWGANKGKFEANNQVTVRVRKVADASRAIGAATGAGANVLSGPSLTIADPEKARLAAHANAYRAAKQRAQAYADAADLKIVRVISIRDGSVQSMGVEPVTMDAAAVEVAAPPPVSMPEQGPPVLAGTSEAVVSVLVQFALAPK